MGIPRFCALAHLDRSVLGCDCAIRACRARKMSSMSMHGLSGIVPRSWTQHQCNTLMLFLVLDRILNTCKRGVLGCLSVISCTGAPR